MEDAKTVPSSQDPLHNRVEESPESHSRKTNFSGSLFSKLTRSLESASDAPSNFPGKECGEEGAAPTQGFISQSALATALQQQRKARKRKGSLRKTALLGNGALRLETRMTRGTASRATQFTTGEGDHSRGKDTEASCISPGTPDSAAIRAPFYNQLTTASPHFPPSPDSPLPPSSWQQTTQVACLPESPPIPSVGSPTSTQVTGTIGNGVDVSARHQPDASFSRLPRRTSNSSLPSLPIPPPRMPSIPTPSSSSDSYGTTHIKDGNMLAPRVRATTSQHIVSPLATDSAEIVIGHEGWDYSETEWWGWIIIIVTWLVFVVGMGSCLGVWSWAWDVGETPYAPPELEDDPTLPIVGYYPALMTLTAVMAWVWVIIAWVGMKYFRHAKISGEDF